MLLTCTRPLKEIVTTQSWLWEKKKLCKIGFGPALTSLPPCVVCVLGARGLIKFVGQGDEGMGKDRLSVWKLHFALQKIYCNNESRVVDDIWSDVKQEGSCMMIQHHIIFAHTYGGWWRGSEPSKTPLILRFELSEIHTDLCCRFMAATIRAVQPRRWRWFGSTPSFNSLMDKRHKNIWSASTFHFPESRLLSLQKRKEKKNHHTPL